MSAQSDREAEIRLAFLIREKREKMIRMTERSRITLEDVVQQVDPNALPAIAATFVEICRFRVAQIEADAERARPVRLESQQKTCSDECPCCNRRNEYSGFGSDGPTIFRCPISCQCHD